MNTQNQIEFLTDGGLETTLVFKEGVELRHFAAFELLKDPIKRRLIRNYFENYLRIAEKYRLAFVLETPTWRANPDWGYKLGYTLAELKDFNHAAVSFLREISKGPLGAKVNHEISGCIGPRGDGYQTSSKMTVEEARCYHDFQIRSLSQAGVDRITAMTLGYEEEAVGIIKASQGYNVPVVISFTLETDGKLPCGTTLKNAIHQVDSATNSYPKFYMVNCAHPEHFKDQFANQEDWHNRIGGIRANASTKSHAELDESTTLDRGDLYQFAIGYQYLKKQLPFLQVIGGCCGTDEEHLEKVCSSLYESLSPSR
jgi:S-methylmethionine-dependent homocysteine/selenocysteine methylase